MFFLIRASFWICIVILFLPTGQDQAQGSMEGFEVSTVEALVAARDTVGDLSAFCMRNPETCETGSAALQVFGQKARYGAQMVYGYLAEDGNLPAEPPSVGDPDAIGTLLADDLAEPWRGPDRNG